MKPTAVIIMGATVMFSPESLYGVSN